MVAAFSEQRGWLLRAFGPAPNGLSIPLVGEDRPQTEHGPDKRRVTVAEAAEILGITAEAVRTRIKCDKLDSIKDPPDRTGTVYVLLDVDQTGPNTDHTSQGQDQTTDQTRQDERLVETLREQVAYLQGVIATRDRELGQRAEEIRRRDAALEREQQLTAIFADRLRELEPPGSRENRPRRSRRSRREKRSGKSSAPRGPAARWRRARCTRGWPRSVAGAKRPNASVTTSVESC